MGAAKKEKEKNKKGQSMKNGEWEWNKWETQKYYKRGIMSIVEKRAIEHTLQTSACCHLNGLLFVCLPVKVNEEEKEGNDNEHSELVRIRIEGGARPGGDKVCVVHRIHLNENGEDELDNLEGGDVFLPPHLDLRSRGSVVVVHEDVNARVEQLAAPLHWHLAFKAHPYQDHGDSVVVYVKEDKLLLFQHEQYGIK
mmetsp:Transcript_34433/g.89128  ORF Transcript_34433/g.89128 Transcript_34433/m.89128 type:complete len:196 (-) Transcript_34433:474-1061(-)